ncbi:MAG: hypothetical protein HW383_780 [Candidatus Magasanikbacteria bacterium]|nr:hypothetical protein [Candidatus Magasanikbacteria bacterium]
MAEEVGFPLAPTRGLGATHRTLAGSRPLAPFESLIRHLHRSHPTKLDACDGGGGGGIRTHEGY